MLNSFDGKGRVNDHSGISVDPLLSLLLMIHPLKSLESTHSGGKSRKFCIENMLFASVVEKQTDTVLFSLV